jgi:hypothetical protein
MGLNSPDAELQKQTFEKNWAPLVGWYIIF